MARLTWLADELRRAGLDVVEVEGWKDRGRDEFAPRGVTWHATAGSRTSTADGEVRVILNGSETAPAPIAQIMADRDGTLYVCAAGLCYHNKQGWDGPNEGLGNYELLGIEMANDNKGEPWPDEQLDAVRRATAVIMRRLGADPMRRLAAHYEHQPYATRPKGEGSTKSDPYGVDMTAERPRVAAIMRGEDDMTEDQFMKWMTKWGRSTDGREVLTTAVLGTEPRKVGSNYPAGTVMNPDAANVKTNPTLAASTALRSAIVGTALGYQNRDRADRILAALTPIARALGVAQADIDAMQAQIAKLPDEVAERLLDPGASPEETAAALRAILGDRATVVGQLLTQAA